MRLKVGIAAAVLFVASHANAAIVLQDFNANPSNLANGAALPTNYFSGMTISNALLVYQGPTTPAIAFNFPNGGQSGDVVSNPANFNGNFLTTAGNPGGSAVMTFVFDSPVNNLGIWLADVDSTESYVLSTFDPSNNSIDSVTVAVGGPGTGDGVATAVSLPGTDIKKLVVTPNLPANQIGFGLDDLTFDNVPEPSCAVMFVLLGGVPALLRTQRLPKA